MKFSKDLKRELIETTAHRWALAREEDPKEGHGIWQVANRQRTLIRSKTELEVMSGNNKLHIVSIWNRISVRNLLMKSYERQTRD